MEHQSSISEPIKHEKARLVTFTKRKTSLMKKAFEFTTLCDVEGCIIIYGPKHRNLPDKPETWESGEGKLISIIRRYKQTVNTADHVEGRTTTLSSSKSESEENKALQVADNAIRPQKKKFVGNYTTWDERMDSFTEDQLKMILGVMDNKIKIVDKKLKGIKGDLRVMKTAESRKLDHADVHRKYSTKPLNLGLAINLQTHNNKVCKKVSSYNSSPLKIQCGGKSDSSIPCNPLQGPVYRNPRLSYERSVVSPATSSGSDENGDRNEID